METREIIGNALREYFNKVGLTQTDAAKKSGVGRSRLCNIIGGRESVGVKAARKLSMTYGFSMPFLISGEGTLFAPNASVPASPTTNNLTNIGDNNTNIIGESNEALKARIAVLEKENEWLRSMVEKAATK